MSLCLLPAICAGHVPLCGQWKVVEVTKPQEALHTSLCFLRNLLTMWVTPVAVTERPVRTMEGREGLFWLEARQGCEMDVTPRPVRKRGEMSASLSCVLFFIQTSGHLLMKTMLGSL